MAQETLSAIVAADLSAFQNALTRMTRLVEHSSERASRSTQQIGVAFDGVERAVTRSTATTQQYGRIANHMMAEISRNVRTLAKGHDDLTKAITSVVNENKRLAQENQRLGSSGVLSFTTLRTAVLGLASAYATVKAVGFAVDAVQTAVQVDRLQRAITAAAGDAKKGAQEWQFLRQESERLGLELLSVADSYKGLLAATQASGKQAEVARVIFRGVAEAATVMGLSAQDTQGTLLALTQIMSKGKVTAEELRQQLGERFPVAVGVMAKALGRSTEELDKLLEQGKITSDALVGFALELSRRYEKDVAGAAKSATAEFNRFKNVVTDLQHLIGTALLPSVTEAARAFQDLIKGFIALDTRAEAFGTSGNLVVEIFRTIKKAASDALPALEGVAEMLRRATAQGAEAEKLRLEAAITEANTAWQQQVTTLERLQKILAKTITTEGEASATARSQAEQVKNQSTVVEEHRGKIDALTKQYQAQHKAIIEGNTAAAKAVQDRIAAEQQAAQAGLKPLGGEDDEKKRAAAIRARIALEKSAASEAVAAFREEMQVIKDLALTHENANKVIAEATNIAKKALEDRLAQAHETGTTEQQIAAARATALAELEKTIAKTRQSLAKDVAENLQEIQQKITEITASELEKELAIRDKKVDELRKRGATEVQIEAYYSQLTVEAYRKTEEEKIKLIEAATKKRLDLIEKFYERETKTQVQNVQRQIEALDKELAEFKGIIPDERLAEARMQGIVDIVNEANKDVEEAQRQSLEEQQRAWQQFADDVAESLGDILFDAFTGGFKDTEDALERLKRTFFRILSEITAQNLTKQFILPFVQQVAPGLFGSAPGQQPAQGQTPVGGQPTAPQLGISTTAQQVTAQQSSQLTQAIQGLLSLFGGGRGPYANAPQGVQGAPANAAGGGGALTVIGRIGGGIATGIGAGIATYNIAAPLFQSVLGETGSGGQAANALGGAVAGAVAGAVVGSVIPVIGTVIGAIVGFIVGGIIGALQKVAKERVIQFASVQVPRFAEDILGASLDGAFEILQTESKNASGEQVSRFKDSVSAFIDTFLFGVEDFVHQLPESVQRILPDQLNARLAEFEQILEEELEVRVISKKGKDLDAAIDQFLAEDLPRLVSDVFGEILERAKRFGEIVQGFDAAIADLEAIQETMTRNFRDQRQELEELLFTPAQTYERRRDELENLLAIFEGATSAERIALAPEIQNLISEIAQLAPNEEVLGQDLPLLIGLQEELLGILGEVEAASLEAVENQIDVATEARDALLDQIGILEASREIFEQELREANVTLNEIADLLEIATNPAALDLIGRALPPIDAYQTGTPFVPSTGLAYLHRGEAVLSPTMAAQWRATGGPSDSGSVYAPTIQNHVEVHVTGHGDARDAQVIANRVIEVIDARLTQRSTFQQSHLDRRTPRYYELRSTAPRQTGG